jgi:hypothetical protein
MQWVGKKKSNELSSTPAKTPLSTSRLHQPIDRNAPQNKPA